MRRTFAALAVTTGLALAAAFPAGAATFQNLPDFFRFHPIDEWNKSQVTISVFSVSRSQSTSVQAVAAFYDAYADGNLVDDTLYLPISALFGDKGIAPGTPWVWRDGRVQFPNRGGVASISVTTLDGVPYVLGFEALGYLGTGVTLSNAKALYMEVW